MRRLLLLLAIVAFAAPSIILRAQRPPAAGILRGIVVREGTSEPIRDVQIAVGIGAGNTRQDLERPATIARGGIIAAAAAEVLANNAAQRAANSSGPQFNTITDNNGRFSIEGING